MIIKLYKTLDNNNVINKELIGGVEFDIKLKENTNVIEPIIILSSSNLLVDFNYAYIPNLNRYYFIKDISINSKNVYVIYLECDVLESFKDDILNSYAYITKSDNGGNRYFNSSYESEVKKECNVYYSDVELELENNNILVVNGKGE